MAEHRECSTENVIIDHFTAQETENGGVICNLCDFTCDAVESVQLEHLIDRHGYKITEEPVVSDPDDPALIKKEGFDVIYEDDRNAGSVEYFTSNITEELRPISDKAQVKGSIWYFFNKTDPKQLRATCNFCKKTFSYRTSVTNLTKHLLSQHSVEKFQAKNEEQVTLAILSEGPRKLSSVWKYFEICDAEEKMATCLMCDAKRSYKTSITNLKKHVERKHQINGEIDPASQAKLDMRDIQTEMEYHNSDGETEMEDQETLSHIEIAEKSSLASSLTWLYFKRVDSDTFTLAECQICHQRVSYERDTVKMEKHLLKKHPDVEIPEKEDGSKRTLLSSNGKLFEVNMKIDVDDNIEQVEHIESNTSFLKNLNVDEPSPKRAKKSTNTAEKTTAICNSSKIATAISNSSKICTAISDTSSDDGIPLEIRKSDSLDHFGQYLVSLLRQLPKKVSNKLQADFISQIMQTQSD